MGRVEIRVQRKCKIFNIHNMANSRRQQAQADMGMNIQKEEQQREQALAREQQRQEEKQAKREALMNTTSYRVMDATAKYMDKYFLDPLLGLIPGGVGDVLTSPVDARRDL